MPSVTLRHGPDKATFCWVPGTDNPNMDVVIDVEEMLNAQTGRMTKEAGRLLWELLKSKGYE